MTTPEKSIPKAVRTAPRPTLLWALPIALQGKRRVLIAVGAVVVAIVAIALLSRDRGKTDSSIEVEASQGKFQVVVNTTGELRASKFVEIQIPPNAQQVNLYQLKISSLVPEGTIVKAGDVVAELDRSGIAAKSSEISLALQKAEAQATQAMLDSTLSLAQAREEIRTLTYALEERRIAKDQARYEAPSVRRQAEIDLEKAERSLGQAKANFVTKKRQAEARMQEVSTDVERQRNLMKLVSQMQEGFTIRAPEPGMVIYEKEWNGKKKVAGSQVSPWDPTVATLPDLAHMESVTFVNEIDVRKISVGQEVKISLDSDPSKRLTGKVTSVANVGEQRPNTDAKVFEVKIMVAESDTTLRPGMTTSNAIVTTTIDGALSVPLEAVFNEDDVPYVYKRAGRRLVRQEIEPGEMNDNEIVVLRGLGTGDRVMLSAPPEKGSVETKRLSGTPKRSATPPDSARTATDPGPAAAAAQPSSGG